MIKIALLFNDQEKKQHAFMLHNYYTSVTVGEQQRCSPSDNTWILFNPGILVNRRCACTMVIQPQEEISDFIYTTEAALQMDSQYSTKDLWGSGRTYHNMERSSRWKKRFLRKKKKYI